MNTVFPLERMTVEEKLRAFEELSLDLARHDVQIPVPDWHLDVLRERDQLVQEDGAERVDLETFKRLVAEDIARGRPQ